MKLGYDRPVSIYPPLEKIMSTATAQEREQVAKNTHRRANFGRTTRKPDPQRWNGVDR